MAAYAFCTPASAAIAMCPPMQPLLPFLKWVLTHFQLTDKAAEVKEGSMTSQFMVTQLAPWLTVLL